MGDRCVTNGETWTMSHNNRSMAKDELMSILYIDSKNLFGSALNQKLPYKDFSFTDIFLDEVFNPDDYIDNGYWVICDLD